MAENKERELRIPPLAQIDDGAIEIVRIWSGSEALHFIIKSDVWKDPFTWGLLLVDLARHSASAYAQAHGTDTGEALKQFKNGFDAEWSNPTD